MLTAYIKPAKDAPDGLYVFSRKITVEQGGVFTVHTFTTGRYILKIDGGYLCEGPCKGHRSVRYYDTVSVPLSPGEHLIEITVLHIGLSNSWRMTSLFKAAKPHVIFRAACGKEVFHSDDSWRCVKKEGYVLKHHSWNIPGEDVTFPGKETVYELVTGEDYDFDHGTRTDTGVDRSEGLQPRPIPLLHPGEEVSFTVVKEGENFVELDAGEYLTAKLSLRLAANTTAKLLCAECYTDNGKKYLRDACVGIQEGWTDSAVTTEETLWEPFWFKAFRFIRIELTRREDLLEIRGLRWNYPMENTAEFSCSDENLNRMYAVSVNTLRCCSFETFVDCPYYEQEQYIMDSTIECAAMLHYTGDTALVRKCITEFAASQTEEGLLLSSYPDDYVQVIPGFCLYWVFLLHDYWQYSANTDFVSRHLGTLDKLLWYFRTHLSPEGLIQRSVWWDFADWVPGWKQGQPVSEQGEPITLYNLYYAAALDKAAALCTAAGRLGLAEEYRSEYERISKAVRQICRDDDGYYCNSRAGTARSVHCALWAVLAGLEGTDYGKKLMSAVGNPAFDQPSFCMTYYLFRAMEQCGMADRIFDHMAGWQKMLDLHCTTWCENPDNPRSECHGWSTAPLYECAANILGVRTGTADEIVIKPAATSLAWAKGSVHTRYGLVTVEREGNSIQITAPGNILKRVILPNGTEQCFTKDNGKFFW